MKGSSLAPDGGPRNHTHETLKFQVESWKNKASTIGAVAARSYGHYCAVAKALDIVGERWSMLVIRELLDGPKRYGDLMDGVPGISTDVLADRLKGLVEAGVVERTELAPPAASRVYRLTPRGQELEAVVDSLATWGSELLSERQPDEAVRPHWIVRALRSQVGTPSLDADVVVRFDLPEGATTVAITPDGVLPADDAGKVDVVVTGTIEALASALLAGGSGELERDGKLSVDGSAAAVRRLQRALWKPAG